MMHGRIQIIQVLNASRTVPLTSQIKSAILCIWHLFSTLWPGPWSLVPECFGVCPAAGVSVNSQASEITAFYSLCHGTENIPHPQEAVCLQTESQLWYKHMKSLECPSYPDFTAIVIYTGGVVCVHKGMQREVLFLVFYVLNWAWYKIVPYQRY